MSQQSSKLNVLLALDSFKGSISAQGACEAITEGLNRACKSFNTELNAQFLPVSDGGEGLLDCLEATLESMGFVEHKVSVLNPHGQSIQARMLINETEGKALIESAEVIGLTLIPEKERTCVGATTYGLGQLIAYAINLGIREINIGLGGTATNDCGLGMMQALGFKFFDITGMQLGLENDKVKPLTALDLAKVAKIDDSAWQERMQSLNSCSGSGIGIIGSNSSSSCGCSGGVKVIGSCDVDNPLLGINGATYIFGPQKGLNQVNLALIEQGMESFATCLTEHYGVDHTQTNGAGAAGGLGAALRYCCAAQLTPGIDMVLNLQGIEEKLQHSDLVIVGEGCMDSQSVRGKAPVGVARFAAKAHIPCIALSGALKGDPQELYAHHIDAMFAIAQGPMSVDESMEQAAILLARSAENVGRCFLLGRKSAV